MLTAHWPAARSRWAWPGRQSTDRGYRWAGWPATWTHAFATEDSRIPHILLWDCSASLPANGEGGERHETAWRRGGDGRTAGWKKSERPETEAAAPPGTQRACPASPTCTPAQPPSSSTAPGTRWPTPRWRAQTPHSRCHGSSETPTMQTRPIITRQCGRAAGSLSCLRNVCPHLVRLC